MMALKAGLSLIDNVNGLQRITGSLILILLLVNHARYVHPCGGGLAGEESNPVLQLLAKNKAATDPLVGSSSFVREVWNGGAASNGGSGVAGGGDQAAIPLGLIPTSCEREAYFDRKYCDEARCERKCDGATLGMRDTSIKEWECKLDKYQQLKCYCAKYGRCCRKYQWWPVLYCQPNSNISCKKRCDADTLDMGPDTRMIVGECRPDPVGEVRCYCEKEGDCLYVDGVIQENDKKEF